MMTFYVLRIVYAAKVGVLLQLAKYYRVKFTQEISSWLFPACFHDAFREIFFRNTGLLGKSGNFVVVHMPSVGFMYSKAVKKTG